MHLARYVVTWYHEIYVFDAPLSLLKSGGYQRKLDGHVITKPSSEDIWDDSGRDWML